MRRYLTIVLSLSALAFGPFGIGEFERGNRLFRAAKYAQAVEAYESAIKHGKSTPDVHYNLGTALLQLKKYAEAEQHFKAALSAVDPTLRQRVYYNLGNRFLFEARESKDSTAQTQQLNAAIDAYKQSLRLRPADLNSKWNLELALKNEKKPPPSGGGGGGGGQNQNDQNKNSSGGQNNSRNSQGGGSQGNSPEPRPLTPQQADRILSAAEQDERELYKDRLKKGQREMPVLRDW